MIPITEKEYKGIKALENKFYDGVDKYCSDLQDTWDFTRYFEEIMDIIANARREK